MQKQGLSALIFGSTGAIGQELVQILLRSPKWSKVHCVVRKELEEWKKLPGSEKLIIEKHEDLDNYFKMENHEYKGIDSLFCCLGSQVKHGEATFVKIDKTYPLLAADIALQTSLFFFIAEIPHYLLFSSKGGDPKSWFLYMRTKGEVEEDMKLKGLNLLSILKPGLLRNRRDARFGEKVAQLIPFIPEIQARDSAQSLRIIAEKYHQEAYKMKNQIKIYENSDMVEIAKDK